MWYKLLKRRIERGELDNIKEIINTMYTAGQMTKEQYEELINSIE